MSVRVKNNAALNVALSMITFDLQDESLLGQSSREYIEDWLRKTITDEFSAGYDTYYDIFTERAIAAPSVVPSNPSTIRFTETIKSNMVVIKLLSRNSDIARFENAVQVFEAAMIDKKS